MNKRFLLVFFLFAIFASSCSKKAVLYSSDAVMEEFEPTYFDYNYLSSRSRISLEEHNGRTTKGTLNVRAKKDSIIWFSLSPGLGIEAARGVLTNEAIKIKDRVNGKDIDMTYDQFEESYGIKLTLDLFQNILFGNLPHELSYRDRLIRVGRTFELYQQRENVRYKSVIGTEHGKVTSLETVSEQHDGELVATYPDFSEVNNQPFAHRILIKMILNLPNKPKSKTLVNLEVNKVDLTDEPLTFPYNF
ncbi:MAG TPA: DUF4292 domain-containing protein [Cyclobacteriaceae bacterium]|nr:DUF4292 domain-containing protein [Cyclobacteriaceae bacterium]